MQEEKLTLVLWGHLFQTEILDLRKFWSGFIELQRNLPSNRKIVQIVAHSWNPELKSLVNLVYSPDVQCHENQPNFYSEFLCHFSPAERFEIGLGRLNSTWKNLSLQSVIGNARSRAKAVKLMDELPEKMGQVLIVHWDLGQSNSAEACQLVYDAAMPSSQLYLLYIAEVDEYYADSWLIAPWSIAHRFGGFDTFVIDALAGKNTYLKNLNVLGWPQSRKKICYKKMLSNVIRKRAYAIASRLISSIHSYIPRRTFQERVLLRLTRPIKLFINRPHLTAENSGVLEGGSVLKTYQSFMNLNIRALFKYFILSEELREKTRFLTPEDFEIGMLTGQIINPQQIVLLLWEDGDDGQPISDLIKASPLPVEAIYLLGGYNIRVWTNMQDNFGTMRVLTPKSNSSLDCIRCALLDAAERLVDSVPFVIMPTSSTFLNCKDWYYLNALLKYILWRKESYVCLKGGSFVRANLEFPGLCMAKGNGVFSFDMGAGAVSGICSLLNSCDITLNGLCKRPEQMKSEFPIVERDGGLF